MTMQARELGPLVAALPEDTVAVLVVQRPGGPPRFFRAGELTDPRINAPRAVWNGVAEALGFETVAESCP